LRWAIQTDPLILATRPYSYSPKKSAAPIPSPGACPQPTEQQGYFPPTAPLLPSASSTCAAALSVMGLESGALPVPLAPAAQHLPPRPAAGCPSPTAFRHVPASRVPGFPAVPRAGGHPSDNTAPGRPRLPSSEKLARLCRAAAPACASDAVLAVMWRSAL